MLTMCVAWGIVNAIVFRTWPAAARCDKRGWNLNGTWNQMNGSTHSAISVSRGRPLQPALHIARRLRGIDANDLPSDGPVKV